MKLKTLFSKPKKEIYFIPNTPRNNIAFKTDEDSGLILKQCDNCLLIKPEVSLYPVKSKHTYWDAVKIDFVEEEVEELMCKKCVSKSF